MVLIQLNLAVQWLAYLALCDEVFHSFGNSHVSGQSLLTYKQLSECIKKRVRGLVWWAAGLFFLDQVDNALETD